jgi:SAM-dependent methyltransferase
MIIGSIAVAALVFLFGFAISGFIGAPWVPAFRRDVKAVLADTALKKGHLYIELGCGDGRLVEEAAKRGAQAIGYEINPVMWFIAVVRTRKYPSAHIYLGNFWKKDLSEADVVMAFLLPKFMERLETKVNAELKSGARLASYIFELPTKHPKVTRHHWRIYEF